MYYERKWKGDDSPEGREAMAQIERIKRNRNWGQPYVRPAARSEPFKPFSLTHFAVR